MNPDTRAPTAVAPASDAEREALLVRAAVQHPVDEHRGADDRRREAVAGERRDRGRRREPGDPEQARVEERVAHAQAADDRREPGDDGDDGEDDRDDRAGSRPPDSGSDRLPSSVSAPSAPTSIAENRIAPTMSTRPGRRGVSQPLLAAQATTRATMPIGTLT